MATQFTEINLSGETKHAVINGTPVVVLPAVLWMCETCGAALLDRGMHDIWHSNQEIHGLR